MHLLEIRDLITGYGKVVVLRNLNLVVEEGEIAAIIGPNGVGKTTLFHSISGLLPYDGEILFAGAPLSGMKPKQIIREGLIQCPEGRWLFPGMSVLDNLEVGAHLTKNKAEVRKNLEIVFSMFPILGDRKKQMAGTLSGGEQQMLAIARSLMSKPKLLMLDEPSFGLSPLIKSFLCENIKKLTMKGQNVLLNEQDTNVAMNIANKFFILDGGKIVFGGFKHLLLENETLKKTYLV